MVQQAVENGQCVQITALQISRGWQGRELVTIPAGTVYQGTVADVTNEGFFDLQLPGGRVLPFNTFDRSITISNCSLS